jgi:hypothetical protein
MATFLITAQVNDLTAWEKGFRTHSDLFAEYGLEAPILYGLGDDNRIAVLMETDDEAALTATLRSPDTIAAMQSDGVRTDTVRMIQLDKQMEIETAGHMA